MTMRLLAALWHDADDVAFVRACVHDRGADGDGDSDEGRDAWRRVLRSGDAWLDPATHAGRRTKAFAPLVLAALDRHGVDPGHQARATLRAWRLHEQLRLDQYREILRRTLRALAEAAATPARAPNVSALAVPAVSPLAFASTGAVAPAPIVLNGLALADIVYPHPLMRHCHDIDLLVAPQVLPRAVVALERSGLTPRWRIKGTDANSSTAADSSAARALAAPVALIDSSGLPIVLHTEAGLETNAGGRLMPPYQIPFETVAAAAAPIAIDGEPVLVLDRAHALVHVCLRGLLRNRGPASLRWMVDAWYLLAAEVSWDRVLACVREHHLGLPVAAGMTLMSTRLGALVPRTPLDALTAEAARAAAAERARLLASFTKTFAVSQVRRRWR